MGSHPCTSALVGGRSQGSAKWEVWRSLSVDDAIKDIPRLTTEMSVIWWRGHCGKALNLFRRCPVSPLSMHHLRLERTTLGLGCRPRKALWLLCSLITYSGATVKDQVFSWCREAEFCRQHWSCGNINQTMTFTTSPYSTYSAWQQVTVFWINVFDTEKSLKGEW